MNNKIVLYSDKSKCCGCGACMNVCPKEAISMKEDDYGFVYPDIDSDKCVKCGQCNRVCAFQNDSNLSVPQKVYAAVNLNEALAKQSSSGGIFPAVAEAILKSGGIVYGAAYEFTEEGIYIKHIGIDNINALNKLQGSKYAQSSLGNVFSSVKENLLSQRKVLFTGTPCQVDALKRYLGKTHENLFTIDIVCHGVPSQKMLRDYMALQTKRTVDSFTFRDKTKPWNVYRIKFQIGNKEKNIHCRLSSFYEYFLQAKIHRENCYVCKYAGQGRAGDLTLGDYWGIEREHKELFAEEKWKARFYRGISCVLVNTEKGYELLQEVKGTVDWVASSYEKVSKENGQLRNPSKMPAERELILNEYVRNGYSSVDKAFFKNLGVKKYKYMLQATIPVGFKKTVKRILGRL